PRGAAAASRRGRACRWAGEVLPPDPRSSTATRGARRRDARSLRTHAERSGGLAFGDSDRLRRRRRERLLLFLTTDWRRDGDLARLHDVLTLRLPDLAGARPCYGGLGHRFLLSLARPSAVARRAG